MAALDRAANIAGMIKGPLDLLVIGGGITGAGIALDAATRGLRVGLVERSDFASGTSSKSSKLIHGGLRYLRQLQFKVTYEASREKQVLQKLAPHLIKDTVFLLPLYGSVATRAAVSAGLWLYDLAAGLPRGMIHRYLTAAEAAEALPGLDASRLRGAYLYHDARADDCRLVMHVLKKAAECGARIANRVEVQGLLLEKGRVTGVRAFDRLEARPIEIAAARVVNATGVWVDRVRAFDAESPKPAVRPSKGVHVVVPRSRVGNRDAAILQSPKDGRIIFLIPWGAHTVIGTTDTDYAGDVDHPRAESGDVQYLLDLVNEHLPKARLVPGDVRSTYAGLRPLLVDESEAPSDASREHHVFESPTGLLSITGGKLTTYRRMARELVDRICPDRKCRTNRIALYPASTPPPGIPPDMADHLLTAYGSEADRIVQMPGSAHRLVAGLPYSEAEVEHAVRFEMAVTVGDVLTRRTRVVLFDPRRGRDIVAKVAEQMAYFLGWNADETRRQIGAYEEEVREYEPAL